MNKRYLILLVIMGLIILSGIMTSCAGGGNATIPGTNAENTAELRTALENEQSRVIYLTGDVYDMTDLVIPSGKSLIGPNSPDYPAQLSKRGSCVLMPSPDATSGALIRINAFSDVVKDVKVSGVKFQLPEDYEWDNMHEFFMVFIQGNSEEASSTLSNITIENCTFDYTTAPDAPEGRDLSTGISVNTTEITKAENITIKNNTFLMKTSNTDCSFGAILINGTANDPEKGIFISGNKIYGGLPNTGRAPFGIIIESPNTVGASSRQNDTLHVKLSNNSFYGKDVQNNVLFFLNLMSVNRNAFDIQLDMTENEFGTLAAPIVGNDKNNNIIWLGFNFDYPTGVIEFTANSMNNSFALKGDQFRSMIDTYFPEPNPYVIKVGSQSFTNTSQVSAALTTQQDYINIVDSVDVLGNCLSEDVPKVIYLTGDVYDITDLVIPSGKSLIGPNSPDYPAQLSKRGNCVLMPSPDATSGALIRIEAYSDEIKDVKISGVKFQLPSDYQWQNMHDFFMIFIQGGSEEASSTLSNITIENCTFDYTTAPDTPDERDLSIGITIDTCQITKAENIRIKNNTFLMKTSNTDRNFGAIRINGTANDSEKGIFISGNKIYGGLPNTGRAPFGINIESPNTVGASSRQNDTLHVKLNNNCFYGKDSQDNVLNFFELMSINRNALDIQLDMTENEFGTLAAPIVGNDKNGNIIWLGFNFDYPAGAIGFTADSENNSFALKGDQFRSMINTYFPEPNPYVIKVGSQSFTNTSQVSAALTTQQDYINIVDSVDVLGNCLSEDVPKVIYTLPGSYTDCCFDVPNNNVSVIGPLSPDYPAVLTQGEAAFTPAPDVTGFNILHFLNQGDPEVAEDFQRENIHFSGLTFTTPSATVLEHLITFFDIAVYYSGGGPSGVIRHDFPDWYLRDFSIDNCVFDFRETSPQNAGINCIVYCSEFCTFEDISISNNTFYVKNLESTYLDGEEAEKPCKIRILDGTCGSANPNKKIKINNNVFSGSEVGSAGTLPTYLTLYPDGGAYNTKEEFYYEIKGNHFVGNKEYNRIIQSHNIKKMNIDFSENTFGSVQTPYRNDVEWNGTAIFYFLEDNPITFTETQTKNNYYAATPDGTINMFYGVSVDEASINFLYGQQQKTGEELTESLINVIH